ncbi:MAG TPA: 3'-5' exonuclease [Candidatus Dormibacteraeota bacterium]|nr:3'-5' exonuclease [Candidatus Dormibacteraeota bacterium]
MKQPVVIRGGPRSGKSATLIERAGESARQGSVAILGATESSARALATRIGARENVLVSSIDDLGISILRHADSSLQFLDEASSYQLFERAAVDLFDGRWPEGDAEIDVNVAELRSPERFLEGAWTLVERLRRASLSPEQMIARAMTGATAFYAHPPNLSAPTMLSYLNDSARSAMNVDAAELLRQHRREIDLAKILAELYRRYLTESDRVHAIDACGILPEACRWLLAHPAAEQRKRFSFDALYVDDAEHCDDRAIDFLEELELNAVVATTVALDPTGAHRPLQGAKLDRLCEQSARFIDLQSPATAQPTTERCKDRSSEALRVAAWFGRSIGDGELPEDCALVLRNLDDAPRFEEALHAREIATARAGTCALFEMRDILDAYALLRWIADPFAHDALLRILEGPRLALADATIATLCGRAASPQGTLFSAGEPEHSDDRSKVIRLGENVLFGACDPLLESPARERILWLRAFHLRHSDRFEALPLLDAIDTLWEEGLAPRGAPGDAAERSRRLALGAFRERIEACAAGDGILALVTLCAHLEAMGRRERCEIPYRRHPSTLPIVTVDAIVGYEFTSVAIPALQAGFFPTYYVPNSFIFTPTYGLAARENAGGERTTRTVKHSYLTYRLKLRERHIDQERRLFAYARSRARAALLLTASGRPTRGINTPEFLEEFRR